MTNKLPPRTNFDATQWGFTTRDFGIAIGGIFLGILQVISPYASIFIRLMIFVFIVITAVVVAFWRVDKVYTLEEYLIALIKERRGYRKVFTKDGGDLDVLDPLAAIDLVDSKNSKPTRLQKSSPTASGRVVFMLPKWLTPKSNEELIFSSISIFSFVLFLFWIGTAGIKDTQNLMIFYRTRLW